MAEATCRRELDLEIPADEVTKKIESVAKEFARVARVDAFLASVGQDFADGHGRVGIERRHRTSRASDTHHFGESRGKVFDPIDDTRGVAKIEG